MRPVSRTWLNTITATVALLGVFVPWIVGTNPRSSDFVSHYAAGQIVRESPQELYSLTLQREHQQTLHARQFLPWVHPAAEALLFGPLSWMGIDAAFRVWQALNLAALCWVACGLRRYLGELTGRQMGAVFAATLIPLGGGLAGGQDHILCLVLYCAAFLLMEDGRDALAGCAIGLAFVRFQLAIPMLVFFIVMRRWRVVGAVVVTAGAMLAASFAVVGRGLASSYRAAMGYTATVHDTASLTHMPSVRGLLAFVVTRPKELAIVTAVVSVLLLVAGAVWWRRADERRFDLAFASALLLALAVDYHSFLYEISLVVLAGVLMERRCPRFEAMLWGMAAAEVVLVPLGGRFALLAPLLVWSAAWAADKAQMQEAPDGERRPGLVSSA
jgi:Glycosyltransferase family 87